MLSTGIKTTHGIRSVNGDLFSARHIGPRDADMVKMLAQISKTSGHKFKSLDDLTNFCIPENIRAIRSDVGVGDQIGEHEALTALRELASRNKIYRSYIGMGYNACIVPQVIQRNVLENPGWYTPYTPYQAEVSQGRLEAMLIYQTLVSDLTGLPISTCSLLDEATAAGEAMRMCVNHAKGKVKGAIKTVAVARNLHPQVIDVIRTRAEPFGVKIVEVDPLSFDPESAQGFCGLIAAYPDTFGTVEDYTKVAERVHKAGGLFVVDTDLLSLAVLREPAAFGADVCVGTSGRFGTPMGYGGGHAAFLATSERFKRIMPGRIIGVSRDAAGARAYRMALGTREQHIRRERATSNICTASALMCQMNAFYAMYHGPDGIKRIADTIREKATTLAYELAARGFDVANKDGAFFDTVVVRMEDGVAAKNALERACKMGYNLRPVGSDSIGIAFDETTTMDDVAAVLAAIANEPKKCGLTAKTVELPKVHARKTKFMENDVFKKYKSEAEITRFLFAHQTRDIGLNSRMIPLGSCTMKLNAAAIMAPITWPEFANMHPFAPRDQAAGYTAMITGLERDLCGITGFAACSLQPLSGASGEHAGLLTIRRHLARTNASHRNVCLIPVSAHGTNPASAVMAGFKPVTVRCDKQGNIDVADFRAKALANKDALACCMMTYPSTHGVFEKTFRECAAITHSCGGYVYMDGANMNAQVGLIKPAELGADVCHLNLHKTFAMPHGGGGPGMGPICCSAALAPSLPGHVVVNGVGGGSSNGAVSGAPWGSASLLPISWMYCKMLGSDGLRKATQTAILNANYMASRLAKHYPLLYTGPGHTVGHEFILDLRPFKHLGVEAEDVAKRLIDYGFHAPTLSFPVANTLMVEPTESEPLSELDRFCDALIAIRKEIADIEAGKLDKVDNPLKNAPHTAREVASDKWNHKYSRDLAAFPAKDVEKDKYWAPVKRVDNTYGDLHLKATLPRYDSI